MLRVYTDSTELYFLYSSFSFCKDPNSDLILSTGIPIQIVIQKLTHNPQSFEHIMHDGAPVFLFRVCAGAARSSLAHAVAESSGIDTQVVERARHVMDAYMVSTT